MRTLVLVDGENITRRYEETLKANPSVQRISKRVHHERGAFVWARNILTDPRYGDVIRVSYFTTVQGNDESIAALEAKLSEVPFIAGRPGFPSAGRLVPHVFKREKGTHKNKSVDINLTIEALRHAYNRSVDQVVILSGDGDYVPLIKEIMRQGVKVYVGAFQSGLSPQLKTAADAFIDLDDFFF